MTQTEPVPPVRHVQLTSPIYTTAQLGHILAVYIGHIPNRQKLHNWLHDAMARGYFSNARQERPYIANSPWVLPRIDIEHYLQATYPQGVLPHITTDFDLTF